MFMKKNMNKSRSYFLYIFLLHYVEDAQGIVGKFGKWAIFRI